MRRPYCYVLIACLVIGVPQAAAQTLPIQKEVEKKLEKARAEKIALEKQIAEALKNNPDIRLAESKVRDAEAELQRMRMKVLSDVTLAHIETQAAQAAVDQEAAAYLDLQRQYEAGKSSKPELEHARQLVAKNKAALAVLQAKLPYLLGRATVTDLSLSLRLDEMRRLADVDDQEFIRRLTLDLLGRLPTPDETKEFMKLPPQDRRKLYADKLESQNLAGTSRQIWRALQSHTELQRDFEAHRADLLRELEATRKPTSPLTEKLRKALDTPVRLTASSITPQAVLEHVRDAMLDGVNLVVRAKALKKDPLEIQLNAPIPAGAILEFLEDELGVVFVLRDYGIVVVDASPTLRLPPGALRVVEVWKSGRVAAAESQSKKQH